MQDFARNMARAFMPKKAENWFLGSKEDEDFLNQNQNNLPSYQQLKNDYSTGKIDNKTFIDGINNRAKYDRISADREYTDERNKNIGLGTLAIASAVPFGAGTAAGSLAATRAIPTMIQGVQRGALTGAMGGVTYGLGESLIDRNKNVFQNTLENAAAGTLGGAAIGAAARGGIQKLKKTTRELDIYSAPEDNRLPKMINDYYKDYERGLNPQRNDLGTIILNSGAMGETNRQKLSKSKEVIGLSKKLKNAQYIRKELPVHSHKYEIKHFHRLRDKNNDYLIAENSKGNKFFYKITGPDLRSPKLEGQNPNNIIPSLSPSFNPSHMGDFLNAGLAGGAMLNRGFSVLNNQKQANEDSQVAPKTETWQSKMGVSENMKLEDYIDIYAKTMMATPFHIYPWANNPSLLPTQKQYK